MIWDVQLWKEEWRKSAGLAGLGEIFSGLTLNNNFLQKGRSNWKVKTFTQFLLSYKIEHSEELESWMKNKSSEIHMSKCVLYFADFLRLNSNIFVIFLSDYERIFIFERR